MASSNIILPITAYSINIVQPLTGDKFKGGGFYGQANGSHNVQWNLYNFVGSIGIQASLEILPTETDWFFVSLGSTSGLGEYSIDTTGHVTKSKTTKFQYTESTSGVFGYNFIGNYVWVRAYITDWTAGTVNSINLSH